MPPEKQVTADKTLQTRYDQLVANGHITNDDAQREVLRALEVLSQQLARTPVAPSLLSRWLGKSPTASRGIYIWGNVGRGKSMLMELFFDYVPMTAKRRVHFHAFMQEVHARLHQLREQSQYRGDPVATLAKEIAEKMRLLCFDELQATDVADASILHRLFSGLFEHGVTIVSTSNHPPASLYTGGVQRERFNKFITLIEEHMQVMALSSPSDYRLQQIGSLQKLYFTPLGPEADRFIENVIGRLTANPAPQQDHIAVQGRTTAFTLYNHAIGRFSFAELCEKNMGAADYLAIARRLDTVILTDIPALAPEQRNEARRFITLIDALYEHKLKLICTAATAPEGIYKSGDGSFEFKRTVSRLAEMQSEKYLHE